jgi:hypothetical protein
MPWLESVPIAVSNNIDESELMRLAQKVRVKEVQVVDRLDGPGTLQVAVWLSVTVTSPHRAVR